MTNRDYDPDLVTQFLKHDYHDRGMMKWQGFFLSDHTSSLNKIDKQKSAAFSQQHGPSMDQEEIAEKINLAIVKNRRVKIEIDEQTIDGIVPKPISGLIQGWVGQQLYINNQAITIEEIRSVNLIQ